MLLDKHEKEIDLGMNWQAATQILIIVLENGTTNKARADAKLELMRMAKLADLYCESVKKEG